MSTVTEQLAALIQIKADIREAINAKGVTVTEADPFYIYASKILEIGGGESTPPTYSPYRTIAEQLTTLNQIKTDIRNAIVSKGVSVPASTPFSDYADKVMEIADGAVVYGFHIDSSISDPPSDAITYLFKNRNYKPVTRRQDGSLNYNSWTNSWIINGVKPCILKPDGTVVCYLNPDDYSKDIDGNTVPITQADMDSDPTSPYYHGNVMVEFPKIWLKIVPDESDATSATVYISDKRVDSNYKDYAYISSSGIHKDHFYMPAYVGSMYDGVIRSVSGAPAKFKINISDYRASCEANGPGWHMELYGTRMLINWLLVLFGKSMDTQSVYGMGACVNGTEAWITNTFVTGCLNSSGLFHGRDNGDVSIIDNQIKLFGIENYWGIFNRFVDGIITSHEDYTYRVKMCFGTEDGSTANGFSNDGTGYVETGVEVMNTTGVKSSDGCLLSLHYDESGIVTPYGRKHPAFPYIGAVPDGCYSFSAAYPSNVVHVSAMGGSSSISRGAGAFCLSLNNVETDDTQWKLGGALSFT